MANTDLCRKMKSFPEAGVTGKHSEWCRDDEETVRAGVGRPIFCGRGLTGGRGLRALAASVALLVGGAAYADEIQAGDVSLQRIKIVGLDGARIAYRTPATELQFIDVSTVERLTVDSIGSLADLNEAESLAARGEYLDAITRYQRALRVAQDFWERLVRARLIRACDRGNDVDTLCKAFVALLADDTAGPVLAAELLPRHAPQADAKRVDAAMKLIDARLETAASQSARVVLEALRLILADRLSLPGVDRYAAELVNAPVPLAVASRLVYGAKSRAYTRRLAVGEQEQVLAAANAELLTAPLAVLPELLLIKARALLAAARTPEESARAAWAAMRIAIHYPDDPLVPEALLLSAEVHERLERLPTAGRLLEECLQHPRVLPAHRDQAAARLERLGEPTP